MTLHRKTPISSLLAHSCLPALFVLSFAPLAIGCGSMATITKRNGIRVDAKIIDSDMRAVHIKTPKGYDQVGISREDIADIDHPGNVAATIGGLLTAYGIYNVKVGLPECNGSAECTGVLLPVAIGAPLLIYGVTTWAISVAAANHYGRPTTSQVTILPLASPDKTNQFYGASARLSF